MCVIHRQWSVYWSMEQIHQPRNLSTELQSSTWPVREAAPMWWISCWPTTWTWTSLTVGGTPLSGRPVAVDTSTSWRNCCRSEFSFPLPLLAITTLICLSLSYLLPCLSLYAPFINPRRACAARVTVVGLCVRPSVRPSVRPLIDNSLLERLLVLKTLSRTQWATKVEKFVGICLKPLRSRVMPRNKSEEANMLIIPTYPRSAFSA